MLLYWIYPIYTIFVFFYISQGSVAAQLSFGGGKWQTFCCKFPAESNGERIFKID